MNLIVSIVLAATPAAAAPAPAELKAAEAIRADEIRAHTRFLAHDLLEGRGTASRGEALARVYIAAQMEAAGLKPGAPDGTWYQPFDVVKVESQTPATLTVQGPKGEVTLKHATEFVAVAGSQQPRSELRDAEIVFVGYGIVAPEFGWDDFKGADLAGKVLLMMNNDPAGDPALFGGKARLYYGRWDYKFESAAARGAAGAIIIHTDPSAGYGWNVIQSGWTGPQFALPEEPGGKHLQVRSWVNEDSARRIAALGGHDLDALRAAAETKGFRPVPLGAKVSLALANTVSKARTANVIGRLPGREGPRAAEAVLYTAHYDHLGTKADAPAGQDAIYNGARDNASGVAAILNIARAFSALPQRPARSILFAAVAAEEQGLLGSRYMAAHSPVPVAKIVADLNVDEMNTWGRTKDMVIVGLGKSTLDEDAKAVAAWQKRTILGDTAPDKGFFYRSDQFAFAKVGVPALFFNSGTDTIGKPGHGAAAEKEYEEKRYHQVTDELTADWDLSGAEEDARMFFHIGVRVANAPKIPTWRPGDEFEAVRKKSQGIQ